MSPAHEPHLTVEKGPGPWQRRKRPALDDEPLSDLTLHVAPLEAFVSVVRESAAGALTVKDDARDGAAGDTAQHLERRVALAVGVVAETAQSGDRAHRLLAEQAGTGLDRYADDDEAARGA